MDTLDRLNLTQAQRDTLWTLFTAARQTGLAMVLDPSDDALRDDAAAVQAFADLLHS